MSSIIPKVPKKKHLYNKNRVAGNSHTRSGCKKSSLNGMSTKAYCGQRMAAMLAALAWKNASSLDSLSKMMRKALQRLPARVKRNRNVKHLLETHVKDWIFTTCTFQAMKVGPREPDYWHGDGGGSLIAIGFGAAGTRSLQFKVGSGDDVTEHTLVNNCGDVYITNPGAFLHRVLHNEMGGSDATAIRIPGMGLCKVAFQLRCDTFVHNRGTVFPAAPHEGWKAASAVVAKWLAKTVIQLPTVKNCEDQLVI